jgi:CTP synthase (UTP-ammonia lyase)
MHALRIAIVGDFDRGKPSHWATEAALFHAAAKVGVAVEPRWIGTPAIAADGAARHLTDVDGVWGAPGGPYASMAGMLRAIEHVRERDLAYLGTCAGFQYALIEFTRNVLGVPDADSAENAPDGRNVVITQVQDPALEPGLPRLCGAGVARVVPGSLLAQVCGEGDLRGQYFCSFETNAAFVPRWQAAGLRVAATGEGGEMRAFELPRNRFFVASLFQPQLSSSHAQPHPIVVGYLRACAGA